MKLGKIGINFSIFKWRSISIAAIVALLIISAQFWVGWMRDDNSIQYLKVAGSCNKQTSITLIDESDKSVEKTILPKLYKFKRKLFKKYATTISQYLFAKVDGMDRCQDGWMGEPEVELIFVYRPLVGVAKFDSLANFDANKSSDMRLLDSPWVKMRIDKSSKLVVRAVFFWNERQFLFDQAVMAGASPTATQPLIPLNSKVFGSYYEAYYYTALILPSQDLEDGPSSYTAGHYDKAKANALINISKQIPIDIMWLFTNLKWSSEFDLIQQVLNDALKRYETKHHELIKSLLNIRFRSLQSEQKHNNVLDLKPIFNIDTYRYTSH